MDHRGFNNADEMNNYMIQKWNKKVRKNDSVVVLGDFSYGTPEQNAEIFPQLHGTIYLIEGNHVYRSLSRFHIQYRLHNQSQDTILKTFLFSPFFYSNGFYYLNQKWLQDIKKIADNYNSNCTDCNENCQ